MPDLLRRRTGVWDSATSQEARDVQGTLRRLQQRHRAIAIADAVLLASAVTALMVAAGRLSGLVPELLGRPLFPLGSFVAVATLLGLTWSRRWTLRTIAGVTDEAAGLENLLVTAEEELRASERTLHRVVGEALFKQVADALEARPIDQAIPTRKLLLATLTAAASLTFVLIVPIQGDMTGRASATREAMAPLAPGTLRVIITPPRYAGRQPTTLLDPVEVEALEGSRIRIEVIGTRRPVQLLEQGRPPVHLAPTGDTASAEIQATSPRVFVIRQVEQKVIDDRLLHIRTIADGQPTVTIHAPGRDLLFAQPTGNVSIDAEAQDDLGVGSLSILYTRVSGSGEALTFKEGEVPIRVNAVNDRTWRAHGQLALAQLGLEDGDTLVYRAVATDRRPGALPVASASYLIEIGKRNDAASAGFAVPDDRDRQAISQQMVILRTERLERDKPTLSADALREQSQLLAVEQRMVRAEFIFMTGGEVQDEVEEAERSEELAEGRFENEGQRELLTAIREMSRAEARLTAADPTQALVFERAALRALQRAFDRRRYFLRTLPERARIDQTRRLSGDLSAARSSTRPTPDDAVDPAIRSIRELIADLAAATASGNGLDAGMAARIAAIDPSSRSLQQSALKLSTRRTNEERVGAAGDAQRVLVDLLKTRLAPPEARVLPRDPMVGELADRMVDRVGRR